MCLDLTSLKAAVVQLEEALTLCNREPYKDDPLIRKHLRAAAIKAFEYTYAISLNMIRRHMDKTATVPDETNYMTFNNFIREALGKDLLRSDVAVWREYRKQRGTTSHTYDEEKAEEVFGMMPDFLKESQYILAKLQEENKSLDQSD